MWPRYKEEQHGQCANTMNFRLEELLFSPKKKGILLMCLNHLKLEHVLNRLEDLDMVSSHHLLSTSLTAESLRKTTLKAVISNFNQKLQTRSSLLTLSTKGQIPTGWYALTVAQACRQCTG